MLNSLFRRDSTAQAAEALFAAANEQARQPAFYAGLGVEDSLEGRFELLTLHVYLILRRLKSAGGAREKLAQNLFDAMFAHLDDALRELGVGDLVIGKRIRRLAEAFYGRVAAYEGGLDNAALPAALSEALARNVYASEKAPHSRALADYVRRAATLIERQPEGRIVAGIILFPPVMGGDKGDV